LRQEPDEGPPRHNARKADFFPVGAQNLSPQSAACPLGSAHEMLREQAISGERR
jgi:hypothetical protein